MGLIEKWNILARKKIYINDTLEISCGRLVVCTVITILAYFGFEVWWIIPAFSLKRREKKKPRK